MYDRLFLGVLGSKHEGYVGGEEVIHLVGQGRLQGQLGEGGRVPDGEAEAGELAQCMMWDRGRVASMSCKK